MLAARQLMGQTLRQSGRRACLAGPGVSVRVSNERSSRQIVSTTHNRQSRSMGEGAGVKARKQRQPGQSTDQQTHIVSRARARIDRVVDRTQTVLHDGIERSRGRLSPALLNDIKVEVSAAWVPLSEVAHIAPAPSGLRVQVPSTSLCNATGAAIARAHIPGVIVERDVDDSTGLHVSVARPTPDMLAGIVANLHEAVQAAKKQIHETRDDAISALGGRVAFGAGQVTEMAEMAVGLIDGMSVAATNSFE